MTQQWYYSRDGKEHGPVSSAVLIEMAKNGDLLPTDLLRKEGTEKPRPAAGFQKLFAKGEARPSQAPQRALPPSGTAIVGLSASRSAESDPADIPQAQSIEPSSADPSSLKGLTMALGIQPAKPGHDPLLGCDIGGVTIIRLIAEGGMGRVYEGKQEKPSRTVAVKVMRPGLTSPSILKRFEYEAEVLGRLQHPGIAHIYSVGVHRMGNASVPYFIMEYIADARTLTKYANDLKLPTRQRLDLFRSVCDAVAHGHQKGVIHRDLKPSNILVDGSGQPKVIDFGVARSTDSDMALTTMQTDVGQLIGTLQYMSPEQFRADPNDIDVRSDVYALGVVLYELLVGKMPYDVKKKAIHEVARIVQEDDPTPLSSFNRALRGDVAVIAGKCLEKDRGQRYSSASEVAADIERYLTGEPISASPPGFIDGLMRLARKHRVAAAAVCAVMASLVVAVIGISVFANRANEARQRAEVEQIAAEQEREKAEQQRKQAEDARATAKIAESRASQERDSAKRRLYEANCYRLQQLIREPNFGLAGALYREIIADWELKTLPIEMRHFKALLEQAIEVRKVSGDQNKRLALSPDCMRLASWSGGNSAQIWDVANSKPLASLDGHRGIITAFAFNSGGTCLATASLDKTIRIWDAANGNQLRVLDGQDSVIGLAFSPDGTRLAAGSYETVRVFDANTGERIFSLEGHSGAIAALAFSPDGARLGTGGGGIRPPDKTARLWDVATGQQLAALDGNTSGIAAIAFSPDGSLLAAGSEDMTARVWNVASGEPMVTMHGHNRLVTSISFSSDSRRIATGSLDKTARLWDVATGRQLAVFEGHTQPILGLRFNSDDKSLATVSPDNTWRLWDVATATPPTVLDCREGQYVQALKFSPDGKHLATVSWDATARLWDVATCKKLSVLVGSAGKNGALAFSPDGALLAAGSRIWNAATGIEQTVLRGHSLQIRSVAFSPDGKRIATASQDKTARLWDVASGDQLALLEGHGDDVLKLAFSPDGLRLATTSKDETVRLWDALDGKQLIVLEGQNRGFCFSPDGAYVATASADNTVRLWDVTTGKQRSVFLGHSNSVTVITFSSDGIHLATGSLDNSARLWDVATASQLKILEGHSAAVSQIAFNPDGSRLATGARDGAARLWDVAAGKELAVLEGHGDSISVITFSPDGTILATGSRDGTARLWGVSNPDVYQARLAALKIEHQLEQQITAWLQDGPNTAVAKLDEAKGKFTPDEYRVAGNMILSRSAGGSSAPDHK